MFDILYIIHEYDKKTCHCLTLSQQRVVVTIQYIDGTFLKKKTTNNLFFLFITPQQSKPLNNKKLHSNKCFGMYSYK